MAKIVVRYEDESGCVLENELHLNMARLQPAQTDFARPARLIDVGPLGRLTEQETNVLRLMGAGLRYQEIAERLYITERTARTHGANILDKLSVSSVAMASTWAKLAGVITPEEVLDLWRVHRPHLVVDAS